MQENMYVQVFKRILARAAQLKPSRTDSSFILLELRWITLAGSLLILQVYSKLL